MIYLQGEALTNDPVIVEKLFNDHRIVSKKIGFSKKSRQTKEFIEPPYLFDEYATTYIVSNKLAQVEEIDDKALEAVLNSNQYKIFCKFRPHYYLVNGSKFGGLFLAYKSDPSKNHADAIIFTQGSIIQVSRLATIAKKQCIYVNLETQCSYEIKFKPNLPRTI